MKDSSLVAKPIEDELKEYIAEHFTYNNGVLSRDDRKNSNGSYDHYGYLIIKVKGRQIKAHRIVWFLNHGVFPDCEIDHINRDRSDNRIDNLRLSNRMEQNRNKDMSPNEKTGVVGVYIDNTTKGLKKKFTTRFNKKSYRFYSLDDAVEFRTKNGMQV